MVKNDLKLILFLSLCFPEIVFFSISFSLFGNAVSTPVLAELRVRALANRSDSDFSLKNDNRLAKMDCNFQLGIFAWSEEPALATPGTKTVS